MKLNKLKQSLLALMAAVLLFTAAIPPAGAADITFHNYKPDQPDLYVSKTVTSTVDGIEAPKDDEFTFKLLLDDAPAKDMEYTVINIDGTEDKLPNSAVRKTDREGTFRLKADQTARFLFVGSGKRYTVIEEERPNYQQTAPEGGPAVGTVEPDGTQVKFANSYTPTKLPPNETPSPAKLTVTKSIRYPEGYQMPTAVAEQKFAFALSIDGEPYALEHYDILDSTGEPVGRGITSSAGRLVLRGGETAKFTNVPADVDYEVQELVDENGLVLDGAGKPTSWYNIASSNAFGATGAASTSAIFTNTNASFYVTKKVTGQGADPDQEFTFRLLDGDGKPWGKEASFYLYNALGELVHDSLQTTAADGSFALKAGQTALFVDIPIGTPYSVQEARSGEYTQVFPEDPEGYTNMVVSAEPEELLFGNRKEDWTGSLVVQKNLRVVGDEPPSVEHSFLFLLEERNVDESDWTPSDGRSYKVSGIYSRTDSEGKFELKAGQAAEFNNLPPNKLYRVSELWQEMEFGEDDSEYEAYYIDPNAAVQETAMTQDRAAKLEFENQYDPNRLDLPVTGGMGTMLFYLAGFPLAAFGAVMLMVRRSRRAPR